MVLESLLGSKRAEKRPFLVFLLGILYSSISVLLVLYLFNRDKGVLLISFIVFMAIPLMYKVIKTEEKKEKYVKKEKTLLAEHKKAIISFTALFLGILLSLSLWYIFLPHTFSKDLFSSQIEEVSITKNKFSGNTTNPDLFFQIFFNNLRVLIFSVLFSFFFGAGAIFIFAWNASLIATAIGTFVKNSFFYASSGIFNMEIYLSSYSYAFLAYMLHGIFEMTSYFIGGLAGGIVSIAVINHDLFSKNFKKILLDSMVLLFFSVISLVFAAVIEVFVTPKFF